MSEQDIRDMLKLDELAEEAGGYVSPFLPQFAALRLPEDPRVLSGKRD